MLQPGVMNWDKRQTLLALGQRFAVSHWWEVSFTRSPPRSSIMHGSQNFSPRGSYQYVHFTQGDVSILHEVRYRMFFGAPRRTCQILYQDAEQMSTNHLTFSRPELWFLFMVESHTVSGSKLFGPSVASTSALWTCFHVVARYCS